jgi:hypothetical protein
MFNNSITWPWQIGGTWPGYSRCHRIRVEQLMFAVRSCIYRLIISFADIQAFM